MVDIDGITKLSKVIALNFDKALSFTIVENPAINGEFSVKTSLNNPTFRLINSSGQETNIEINKQAENLFKIKSNTIVAGIYYLSINSEGNLISKKIIIQ